MIKVWALPRHNSTSGGKDYYPSIDELLAADSNGFKRLTGKLTKDSILCLLCDSLSHLKQAKSTSDRFSTLENKLDTLITNTETSPGGLPVTWLNTIWLNFFVESIGLKILSQVTTKLSKLHSNSRKKYVNSRKYHNVGHMQCMHARPHRCKDQLPLRSLRDLRSRRGFAPVRPRLARWEYKRPQGAAGH